jgi:prepilin-type N-terminal cleavage/methylation domain-containing protein
MTHSEPHARPSPSAGFSLIELLVVMGILGLAAALSLPAIGRYIRNYRIRGATSQVAGEIQASRNRAISKNVNLGVVFLTLSDTTYQWAVEDDQTGTGAGRSSIRPTLNATFLADKAQATGVFTLPTGIRFTQTCPPPTPPTGSGAAWDAGMRFNRFGAWCDPGSSTSTCPNLGTGQNFVYNINPSAGDANYPGGSVICLTDTNSSLQRNVTVLIGGRVLAQP